MNSVLSITHRFTGLVLSAGSAYLVVWLLALAGGEEAFQSANEWLGSLFGKIIILGMLFAFYFHLFSGIRHMVWDAGKGYDLKSVTWGSISVLVATAVFTALTWFAATTYGGGTIYG